MTKDKDAVYEKQRRKARRALIGQKFGKAKIVRLGRPIHTRFNAPKLIPIKLSDGTFRVLWGDAMPTAVMTFSPEEIGDAIRNSRKMPEVGPGIAGDVLHIVTYPKKKGIERANIRTFYNSKDGRPDEIRYVKKEG